jgi:hypothetical protein
VVLETDGQDRLVTSLTVTRSVVSPVEMAVRVRATDALRGAEFRTVTTTMARSASWGCYRGAEGPGGEVVGDVDVVRLR